VARVVEVRGSPGAMRAPGTEIRFKLTHVYAPVLGLTIAILATYSLLNWTFIARGVSSPLNDNVVDAPLGLNS
jgi:hypothetical protein